MLDQSALSGSSTMRYANINYIYFKLYNTHISIFYRSYDNRKINEKTQNVQIMLVKI